MLVSMNSESYGLYIPRELASKSAAILYSISMATKSHLKGATFVDLKKAQKIFDFIVTNVNLPDTRDGVQNNLLDKCSVMLETLNDVAKSKMTEQPT